MNVSPSEITLPTGVTLQYIEQGDPAGVPVVMLHGIAGSWRSFESVLPHLPASLRVFALSQRGHGDSGKPRGGYRTRDFAADAAAFVDALDLAPAIVVGHSMGTSNALRLAIDRPDSVRALVLAAAFGSYRGKPLLAMLQRTVVERLADPVPRKLATAFQLHSLARPVPVDYLQAAIDESLKVPAEVFRAVFAGLMEDDFVAGLSSIRMPTLLAWGDRDAMALRGDQYALLATLPQAQLSVYRGYGHALHREAPRRFAHELLRFVTTLDAGRGYERAAFSSNPIPASNSNSSTRRSKLSV